MISGYKTYIAAGVNHFCGSGILSGTSLGFIGVGVAF